MTYKYNVSMYIRNIADSIMWKADFTYAGMLNGGIYDSTLLYYRCKKCLAASIVIEIKGIDILNNNTHERMEELLNKKCCMAILIHECPI